jgi:tetratricopeptide (TPR) repeat protein
MSDAMQSPSARGDEMTMTSLRSCVCAALVVFVVSSDAVAQTPSPAEQRVAAAQRAVTANSDKYESYNELAMALARRARETSDTAYYSRAEEAITRSLQLSPGNFEAQKVRVWVLLGKHEFRQALASAIALNKQAPDDLLVYGFLTDAHVELGNYKEAEEACQWMLDLRPGNIPAFTRAAYLRELFGDLEGAIELMTQAYQRTPPLETEDRAWILTQLGHLETIAGRTENAERLLQEALALFSDYHYALANLAKVRMVQKKYSDAADLLKRHYAGSPHPENLYTLGVALERSGRQADAMAAFSDFEVRALRESEGWDNANRELVFYYADHARKPVEALRIARIEIARRQDVHTLDAYAWALYANGMYPEAREHIERALAVGIKDPEVLSRAAIIKEKTPAMSAAN